MDDESATLLWDPAHDTRTQAGTRFGTSADSKDGIPADEETWTLLADGSVMTVEIAPIKNGPNVAERYLPATDQWVKAGNTAQPLMIPSAPTRAIRDSPDRPAAAR
jgi:hypothetical protein